MAVAKFQTMTEPFFQFDCLSWHGPWNKLNKQECEKDKKVKRTHDEEAVEFSCGDAVAKVRYSVGRLFDIEKTSFFRYFMVVMNGFREEQNNIPILIGGDFNISLDIIKDTPPFRICPYEVSPRREKKFKIIDYFIVTEELDMKNIKWLNLKSDTVILDGRFL